VPYGPRRTAHWLVPAWRETTSAGGRLG
jgi:hypothetical protein